MKGLTLSVLGDGLAVCRLDPDAELPGWAAGGAFWSVTRTPDELSVVCPEGRVPDGIVFQGGWRALGIEGPLDFGLTGVLLAVAAPLAEAGVPIFVVSTYDTDYVLVGEDRLEEAVGTLRAAGHEVRW